MQWPTLQDLEEVALRELLPAPGSELYYALLFVPPSIRPALTLLEAFRRLLATVPQHCSNPAIARAKLAWWHGELHTLNTSAARHVMVRALAPLTARDPALVPALFALVDGIAGLLDETRFATTATRLECYTRTHGPLWEAHARMCGLTQEAPRLALRHLGVCIELAYGLRDLRRTIDAGIAWLCRTHEPTPVAHRTDILTTAAWYVAVARAEVPFLQAELRAAQTALERWDNRSAPLRAIYVLCDLARLTLDEIAADGYHVWERRVEITPLRKFWRALKIRIAT